MISRKIMLYHGLWGSDKQNGKWHAGCQSVFSINLDFWLELTRLIFQINPIHFYNSFGPKGMLLFIT